MFRITAPKGLLLAAYLVFGSLAMAADSSIDQIDQVAKTGKLREENRPAVQALLDHPQSVKEHFDKVALLLKQGRLPADRTELSTTERLAPGLPYAKPDVPEPSNQGAGGQLLWELILAAIGVLIAGHLVFRRPSASTNVPYVSARDASATRANAVGIHGFGVANESSWDGRSLRLEGGGKCK